MRDDMSVTDLVTRARIGDQQAWDALVERYTPLVWSVCRQYWLGITDAQDVGQTVWLRLVDHLGNLCDPAALAGWLATTTRRECIRVIGAAERPALAQACDAENIPDSNQCGMAERELLLHERNAALREAFRDLPRDCQRLLGLLTEDPPLSYAQISAMLGIPVDSIGPSRGRCLAKLRRHPAVAALIKPEPSSGGELGRRNDRDFSTPAYRSAQRQAQDHRELVAHTPAMPRISHPGQHRQ